MAYYLPRNDAVARFRAEQAKQEVKELVERELKCPVCGYTVATAFSDAAGHFKVKCQKCKTISVINFAYFYRQKHNRKKLWHYPPLRRRKKHNIIM